MCSGREREATGMRTCLERIWLVSMASTRQEPACILAGSIALHLFGGCLTMMPPVADKLAGVGDIEL